MFQVKPSNVSMYTFTIRGALSDMETFAEVAFTLHINQTEVIQPYLKLSEVNVFG